MPSQRVMGGRKILLVLAHIGFLWNELWSVSRYVRGRPSGWWRLCGNDQQCLAAPIWKYRSGFGDHRFTFFMDLFPNYTFYTNLTNIVYWVVVDRDVPHLITLNLGKVEKKYAKSFDAGLSNWLLSAIYQIFQPWNGKTNDSIYDVSRLQTWMNTCDEATCGDNWCFLYEQQFRRQ